MEEPAGTQKVHIIAPAQVALRENSVTEDHHVSVLESAPSIVLESVAELVELRPPIWESKSSMK